MQKHMRHLIAIDGASFFESHYKRIAWSIRSQDHTESAAEKQEDSKSKAGNAREAMREHLAHITEHLEKERGLVDYEVALEFTAQTSDAQKEEFTRLFNEFNTRDESN